jgi:hypothetical protein
MARFGVDLAVVVTDTFGRPWREGLVEVAIGCAGMEPLLDLRGREDLQGRTLHHTVVALADEVAAASGLVMEKDSRVAAAIVRGVRYTPGTTGAATALVRRPRSTSSGSLVDSRADVRGALRVPRAAVPDHAGPALPLPEPVRRGGGRRPRLRHRAPEGFLSLVGEAGTGKTTLLRHVLDTLAGNVRTVVLLHPTVEFDEILEYIMAELGVPTEGARKLVLLQRLHEFLVEHTRAGGNVALLIDEAQDLETRVLEELRLLSNLETGTEKILQIVLAGQPELETKLADQSLRQLRQRIALHIRLRPLSSDEVAAYIRRGSSSPARRAPTSSRPMPPRASRPSARAFRAS